LLSLLLSFMLLLLLLMFFFNDTCPRSCINRRVNKTTVEIFQMRYIYFLNPEWSEECIGFILMTFFMCVLPRFVWEKMLQPSKWMVISGRTFDQVDTLGPTTLLNNWEKLSIIRDKTGICTQHQFLTKLFFFFYIKRQEGIMIECWNGH